jgi:hypothetical protein
MTSLKTTWLASLALGCAFGGTALAQSPPQPQQPDETTNPDDTTAPDDTMAPSNEPVETGSDVDVNADVNTPAPDADVNVNVNTPPPPPPTYTTPPASYTTVVVPDSDRGAYGDEYMPRYGIAIAAGGGASGFTSESLRGTTNPGGDWDVRLTFGTRSPLAFEASYIGSAQSIDALGLDSDAVLVGNGVQGALRLNTTIDLPVQPFIYGGVAWRRYDLTNTSANTSDISDSDDVLEVPLGVGIAGKFQGLIVDARGEFRPAWFQDLVPEIINDTGLSDGYGSMHRWGVNASVGYEF